MIPEKLTTRDRPFGSSVWILGSLLCAVFVIGQFMMPKSYMDIDQVAWHEEARSIILDGTLSVDESTAKSRGWYYVSNPRDGRFYSKYGLLNGLLLVPALDLELLITGKLPHETRSDRNPTRVLIINEFYVLQSLVIAILLWLVSSRYTESPWRRALFIAMTLYCTNLWHYIRFPSSEASQVWLFLLFWLFFLRFTRRQEPIDSRPKRDLYWAWFSLFLLCQARVADLYLLLLFGGYLSWMAWRGALSKSQRIWFLATMAVFPIVLIVDVQGLVHFVKFGDPFLSGYHQHWEKPNPHTVWQVLWEFSLHPQWSFFVVFPILILAVPGWWAYLRRHTSEAIFLLAILLGMFAIVEPLPFWRGEHAYGPRYFLYLMPVLSLPALYVLNWIGRAWLVPLILTAVFLVVAQFQVQRYRFFDWCEPLRNLAGKDPDAEYYFRNTPVPKIYWDHLRCGDHLEVLPYYVSMAHGMTPEQLQAWKQKVHSRITYSNLLWFPDINK
jgi:hypothetical protein